MLGHVLQIIGVLLQYWICLAQFVFANKQYSECVLFPQDKHARVQIFSLSLIFKLWSEKHYRSSTFQQDMLDNLKNVAIPGTGIPLSWFCYSKITAMFFIFLLNPLICLFGAVNQASIYRHGNSSTEFFKLLEEYFTKNLLHPDDWFSLWRMNCRLVSYHSLITNSQDYKMEDKWTFLIAGKSLQVPVSPYDDTTEAIVCKNKLIEGGMGIHFYKNAAFGGDWIIQEQLQNATWLNQLLPANAPLSTMRIITTSSFTLSEEYPLKQNRDLLNKSSLSSSSSDEEDEEDDIHTHGLTPVRNEVSTSSPITPTPLQSVDHQPADHQLYIRAESAVLRLGRMHANTDHSSILFDVDIATGVIQGGTTNAHWYQLGLEKVLQKKTPWLPPAKRMKQHIDPPYPTVMGQTVPNMTEALEIVTKAHYALMPEVPIVGWDVAFTSKGIFLLEVNLSCNFFRGSFDLVKYIDFIDRHWLQLEKMAQLNSDFQENHTSKSNTILNTNLSTNNNSITENNNANNNMNNNGTSYSRRSSKTNVLLSIERPNNFIHNNSNHTVNPAVDVFDELLQDGSDLDETFSRTNNHSSSSSSSNNIHNMALHATSASDFVGKEHETTGDTTLNTSSNANLNSASANTIAAADTPVLPQNPAQLKKYKRNSFKSANDA